MNRPLQAPEDRAATAVRGLIEAQARSNERIRDLLDSLQGKVEQNAAQSTRAASRASELQGASRDIRHAIHALDESMAAFQSGAAALEAVVAELRGAAKDAQRIHWIVEQSKMLALNGSIEAVRVGERGRGFMVVADEMRQLSAQSGQLATAVTERLEGCTQELEALTEGMTSQVQERSRERDQSTEALRSLDDLVTEVGADIHDMDRRHDEEHDLVGMVTESLKTSLEAQQGLASQALGELIGHTFINITVHDARRDLARFDHVLDVRRPSEYNDELSHIAGTRLITIGDDFEQRIADLPRNARVLMVCRSGGRSARAAQAAIDAGFTHVRNMEGGMLAWNQAGLPTAARPDGRLA